jgi:hypothetical protein
MMHVLRANYGGGFYRTPNVGGWRRFPKLPKRQRGKMRCVTGHLPWGLHEHVPRPCVYAVMLREPTARLVSLWRFVRHFRAHAWRKRTRGLSLAEFCRCGMADADNGMVRWLAGRSDVGAGRSKRPVTDADLEAAKEHLAGFAAVGFVDAFDAGLAQFAVTFGWRRTGWTRKMVGRTWPKPSKDDLAEAHELNKWDFDLYAWARERFL